MSTRDQQPDDEGDTDPRLRDLACVANHLERRDPSAADRYIVRVAREIARDLTKRLDRSENLMRAAIEENLEVHRQIQQQLERRLPTEEAHEWLRQRHRASQACAGRRAGLVDAIVKQAGGLLVIGALMAIGWVIVNLPAVARFFGAH